MIKWAHKDGRAVADLGPLGLTTYRGTGGAFCWRVIVRKDGEWTSAAWGSSTDGATSIVDVEQAARDTIASGALDGCDPSEALAVRLALFSGDGAHIPDAIESMDRWMRETCRSVAEREIQRSMEATLDLAVAAAEDAVREEIATRRSVTRDPLWIASLTAYAVGLFVAVWAVIR